MKALYVFVSFTLLALCIVYCQEKDETKPPALFPVSQDNKFGYIDVGGKIIINPQYEDASNFSEGLARVKVKGKFGYIDCNGKMVIKPQFDEAHNFSEGLACVKINGKFGYIDKTGTVIVNPQYNKVYFFSDFSEGLACVEVNEKAGYIDRTGKMVIPPKFNIIGTILDKHVYKNDDGTVTVVDDDRLCDGMEYTSTYKFREGLACVLIGNRYGYINKKGEVIIEPKFPFAYGFSEGLACVSAELTVDAAGVNGMPKFGYIDKTGKMIIELQFETAFSFSEGLACVATNNRYGYIDKSGKVVIPYEFELHFRFISSSEVSDLSGVWNFSDGLAAVVLKPMMNNTRPANCWGYIDKTGKIIINPSFVNPTGFSNGLAKIYFYSKDNIKIGYIDKTGRYVWEPSK